MPTTSTSESPIAFVAIPRRLPFYLPSVFVHARGSLVWQHSLEAFSAKLRNETDLDALNDDLVSVVRETMQPTRLAVAASRCCS